MASGTTRRQRRVIGGSLAAALLIVLTLGSGVVSAQENAETGEAADLAAMSEATMISLDLTVTEITDPGTLWLDEDGLHIRGLTGISSVSGDITGTANTVTDIDWAAPCNETTLVCQGAQVSTTELTITDDSGSWEGHMQLVVDPANANTTVTGSLVGGGGNAGGLISLNEVTARTDVSLSLTGYQVIGMKPVGGINLLVNVCIIDESTASGGFLARYVIEDGGLAQASIAISGSSISIDATFTGSHGTLMGNAVEMVTAENGSAGTFVLMGTGGDYTGYVGFGRTGTQVVMSSLCDSGYEAHAFWIGEVYIGN